MPPPLGLHAFFFKLGLLRWLSGSRCVPPSLTAWVRSLGPTRRKETTVHITSARNEDSWGPSHSMTDIDWADLVQVTSALIHECNGPAGSRRHRSSSPDLWPLQSSYFLFHDGPCALRRGCEVDVQFAAEPLSHLVSALGIIKQKFKMAQNWAWDGSRRD